MVTRLGIVANFVCCMEHSSTELFLGKSPMAPVGNSFGMQSVIVMWCSAGTVVDYGSYSSIPFFYFQSL